MPYYPDGHLGQHLERLREQQFVSALRQILLGLRHLHGRRIIHRDLKPENLLVKFDMAKNKLALVIADFGFSKRLIRTNDLLKTFCGTLLYAAPDIFPGRSDDGYGANVDIWAAGVIIFGCIWSLPKAPDTPWRKNARQQAAAIEKWISSWTRSLLEKLYDKDENDDQVIKILLHMIDPNFETRYSADQCLEAGCRNGLFKKTADGDIVDKDEKDATVDDTTQAPADSTLSDDTDRTETPPPRSSQPPETNANNATILAENLWGELREELDEESANSPSNAGERTTRRQRT